MNKTLVSIITPVYNAEEYLPDFLDSLKKQIFKDFEVIFVDDGSTDNSLKLLKEFEESNKNTTILTQRRKYAGIARNLGLTKAVGEYVIFLDADDIAEPDLISRAIVAAKNFKTDIVVFGVYAFNSKQGIQGRVKLPWTSNVKLIPPETPFNFSSSKGHIFKITTPAPWNKFYRRDFIISNMLEFQGTRSANDLSFVFTSLIKAKRIVLLDSYLINYRRFHNSLQSTQQKEPDSFFKAIDNLEFQIKKSGFNNELSKEFKEFSIGWFVYNLSTIKPFFSYMKVFYKIRKLIKDRKLEDNLSELSLEKNVKNKFADLMYSNPLKFYFKYVRKN